MFKNRAFRSGMLVALLVAGGLVLFSPAPANACMGCSIRVCIDIGIEVCACLANLEEVDLFDPVVVTFPDGNLEKPTRASIGIFGYTTAHIEDGLTCIVAMPKVPGIASVDSVVNYNTLTGKPLPGVTFSSVSAPAAEVGQLGRGAGIGDGEEWFTYVSDIRNTVADGLPNHFVLEVTLDGKTSAEEIIRGLRQQGAFFTGPSDEAGFPNHHLFLKNMKDFDVMALFPATPTETRERGTRLTPLQP